MTNKERTKILYLITKSNWGGAQRYVFDLAESLYSDQIEPVVATGGDGILTGMLNNAGIKVIQIPGLQRDVSLRKEILSLFAIMKIIKRERPDVLHVNSSKAGAIGALAGRLIRVDKIVFTAHGWAFNEDRPKWQKYIIKFIHWLTIVLSHKTITVSSGMQKEMDWPLVQNKMTTINPGRSHIDFKFKEDARGALEMKVIDNDASLLDYHQDFWLGTIAELHPIKRLNRVIDSMAALTKEFPNLRFVIIHDGELRSQLEQQVRDLGLEKHVFFTGAIVEAARFLPAFDLFVLPSKSESFGYVIIEAGQASVPVVATSVGGITDIIENEVNGLLVPPDDTPALKKALKRLIEDKDLRHRFAQAHFVRAKEFTVEKMVRETLSIYDITIPPQLTAEELYNESPNNDA